MERRPVDRAVSNDDRTAMSVQLLENEFSEQQDISPLLRESIVEANKEIARLSSLLRDFRSFARTQFIEPQRTDLRN